MPMQHVAPWAASPDESMSPASRRCYGLPSTTSCAQTAGCIQSAESSWFGPIRGPGFLPVPGRKQHGHKPEARSSARTLPQDSQCAAALGARWLLIGRFSLSQRSADEDRLEVFPRERRSLLTAVSPTPLDLRRIQSPCPTSPGTTRTWAIRPGAYAQRPYAKLPVWSSRSAARFGCLWPRTNRGELVQESFMLLRPSLTGLAR